VKFSNEITQIFENEFLYICNNTAELVLHTHIHLYIYIHTYVHTDNTGKIERREETQRRIQKTCVERVQRY